MSAGARLAAHAGRPVAHGRRRQQPHDLVGDASRPAAARSRRRRDRRWSCAVGGDQPAVAAVRRRLAIRRTVIDRKPIVVAIPERVSPRRGGLAVDDRREHVVDERQDLRRRPEADRDRLPRPPSGRSASMNAAASSTHRDVGVAKAVDRLLAVADDEDGRRQRVVGRAEALAPALARAARRAPTARGWCPETRRRARGGSALRDASGSRANSSMSFSSLTARSRTPEKSSSACASSVR